MSGDALATPKVIEKESTGTGDGLEGRVILFNCDCHSYDDVIDLLCKSIPGMIPSRAFELAWTIDNTGQAEVFSGEMDTCNEIAASLGEGGLRVQVQ
jgi:ATP-dependent Clp protease adaptor protein ClpS